MRVLLLAFLVAATGCEPQDWFLVIGQSNAVGNSSQPTEAAPGRVFRATPFSWWPAVEDPHVHAAPPGDRGSPWPAFARVRGDAPALVAAARGSSCLLTWPLEPHTRRGRWNPDTGDLYERAHNAWQNGADSPPLVAVLFHQGECDAQGAWNEGRGYQETFDLYLAALLELADAVGRDYAAPLVVAPISRRLCRWDNPDCAGAPDWPSAKTLPVHDATVEAARLHPGIVLGPSSDDLRLMPDGIHTWDVNELGRRWADALAAAGL